MKKIYFLLFLFVFYSLTAQETIEKKFDLPNGTSKNIKIYIPKGHDTDTIYKYPVSIVLNDEYLYNLYKGNAQLFAAADLAPKQIVVGIPTDQSKGKDVSIINKTLSLTENSSNLFNFIKKTLIPYLKANYKTSPFYSIAGEGDAANFLIYFLEEEKPIFNSYQCIAPNFTPRTNRLIQSFNLERFKKGENTYFLYISDCSGKNGKTKTVLDELNSYLSSSENPRLKLQFDSFDNSPNKLSSISESIPRGFSHSFKPYRNISKKEYDENIKDLGALEAIKYLENKYSDIEFLYGTSMNVRLEDFYAIEGIVMDKQDGDYLRVLGDFALIKYPDLPLGDYYMGMFFEKGKDYKKAEEYYKYGYGKMDPSNPRIDDFYKNLERIAKLIKTMPEPEKIEEEEEEDNNENDDNN